MLAVKQAQLAQLEEGRRRLEQEELAARERWKAKMEADRKQMELKMTLAYIEERCRANMVCEKEQENQRKNTKKRLKVKRVQGSGQNNNGSGSYFGTAGKARDAPIRRSREISNRNISGMSIGADAEQRITVLPLDLNEPPCSVEATLQVPQLPPPSPIRPVPPLGSARKHRKEMQHRSRQKARNLYEQKTAGTRSIRKGKSPRIRATVKTKSRLISQTDKITF